MQLGNGSGQGSDVCKSYRWLLVFFWSIGLICGCWLFVRSGLFLNLQMRSPLGGTVSIVWLFLVTVFPFFLFAASAFFSVRSLCFLVCFFKAVLFSFASLSVWQFLGSAGWFFRWILLFSDCASVCLFLLLCLRNFPIGNSGTVRLWSILLYLALIFFLCSVDYRIISPVWADVI